MTYKTKLQDSDLKINLSWTNVADALKACKPKEQLVLLKKFGLESGKEISLQQIWKQYWLTRERIRQIENQGLLKFRKAIVGNKKYMTVIEEAIKILNSQWWFLLEEDLISKLLNRWISNFTPQELKLIVVSDFDIYHLRRNRLIKKSFYLEPLYETLLTEIAKFVIRYFEKSKQPEDIYNFIEIVKDRFKIHADNVFYLNKKSFYLNFFKAIKWVAIFDGKIWLETFDEINPKTIKQKLVYIFRRIWKPMHYEEAANKIMEWFPEKKIKINTVHNELVKNSDVFVNMGVGLYGLREWWIQWGTVKDIITRILEKSNRPLSIKEITKEVLKEKMVSSNTISMVLQKYDDFVRVSKGVYALKGKKYN